MEGNANDVLNMVRVFWPIVYAGGAIFVFLVVWAVRLESKVVYLEKDHVEAKESSAKKHETLWGKLDAVITALGIVNVGFGRLEEKVDSIRRNQ